MIKLSKEDVKDIIDSASLSLPSVVITVSYNEEEKRNHYYATHFYEGRDGKKNSNVWYTSKLDNMFNWIKNAVFKETNNDSTKR